MRPERHRKLIVLLLVALLVPCAVLIVLSVRMIRQERELSAKRADDERQSLATQASSELLRRLEPLKLQAQDALAAQPPSGFTHPALALAARLDGERFVPPWEEDSSGLKSPPADSSPDFAEKVREGEQQEFREKRPETACALYQEALELTRSPDERARVRLNLARALVKAGRLPEARDHDRQLVSLPSTLVDDQGIPYRLYAASRLKAEQGSEVAVREALQAVLEEPVWFTPPAYYMAAELAASLDGRAPELERMIEACIRDVEQVLALQAQLPRLTAAEQTPDGEPVWTRLGEPSWLVSVARPVGGLPAALVAARADAVLGSLPERPVRFLEEKASGAWPVGVSFPGLYLDFTSPRSEAAEEWSLRQSFYLATLLLVASVMIVGAFLLWRDVRRELRTAEMRAQFVSSVSHELKTPLTAIRMFAETLRMRRWKEDHTQQEYLETIVDESERLARLVDNVLDFSRIERGKKIYNLKPTSLTDVVHAAARAVRYPMGQQGFRLRVEMEEGLPPVRADTDALEQAVLNLLTNAMKYSGDAREIGLRLRRLDGRARIEVSDCGIGIPPEEQARIFEKFYRAPTRENQLIPGAGLGLTLVDHVAEAHGGQVKVESAPGDGSTFSIELPLEDGQ